MRETILTAGAGTRFLPPMIRERCHQVDVISHRDLDDENVDTANVTGLIGWQFDVELLSKLPNLRWIQILSVGILDGVIDVAKNRNIALTNTQGLYGDSVADYVLWALLTLSRNFQTVVRNQSKRRWEQVGGPGLNGKKVGILGVGDIGRAVATRVKGFQTHTVGIVRNSGQQLPVDNIDELVCVDNLNSLVKDLDALVLSVPSTPLTRGLVGSKLISRMRKNMIIVSVSRPGVIDVAATARALKRGKIAGAAIDCFEKEPLKWWNRLWGIDNLLVTPHLSALTDDYKDRVSNLICANIDRHCAGQPMLNLVDVDKAY